MKGLSLRAVKRASKVVSSIRKSTLDSECLDKSVGFRIPSANTTRWNSQLFMLMKLDEALTKDRSLQEIIKRLQPFQEATDEFQRDSETVGSVIPAFLDLRYKMEELSRPSGCISHHREIAAILLKSFENMFMTMVSFYLVIF